MDFGGFSSVVKDFHFAFKTEIETTKMCFPAPSPFSCQCLPGTSSLLLTLGPGSQPALALADVCVSCFMLSLPLAISFALVVSAGKSPWGSPGKDQLSRRGRCSGAAPKGTPLCLLPVYPTTPAPCSVASASPLVDSLILWGLT